MNTRKCPYCGKKISYITALLEKSRGEHTCNKCHRNSTIYYTKGMKVSIILTIVIAIIILVVCLFPNFRGNIWDLLWVFIPFLVFYLSVPCFFRLVPLRPRQNIPVKEKKKKKTKESHFFNVSQPSSGYTKIINKVNLQSDKISENSNDRTKIMPQIKE